MKKLKFILVVMFGLSFSLEAFSAEVAAEPVRRGPDMSLYEVDHENFQAEMTFEEEMGVDITNDDLESALKDAFASR